MSYAVSLAQRNIIYNQGVISKQNRGRKFTGYLLILLIISFSVLYVIQANSIATGGYRIEKYKNELKSLQSENKNLELKLSEVQLLSNLEKKVESLKMVKIGKIEYLLPISKVAANQLNRYAE